MNDYRRLNVALSRARRGLVLVTNLEILKADPLLSELAQYYQSHHAINHVTVDEEDSPQGNFAFASDNYRSFDY